MPATDPDIGKLINKIYDTLIQSDGASDVSKAIAEMAGGQTAALATRNLQRDSLVAPSEMAYNIDLDSAKAYAQHFDIIRPTRLLEKMSRPGELMVGSHIVTSPAYKTSRYYNEWARKLDHWDYIGVTLARDPAVMAFYAILRPHRSGLVTPAEINTMKAIAPHLQRAYAISNLFSAQKTKLRLLETVVAKVGFGVVLTTENGQIVYANSAAEEQMQSNRGLKYENGQITASHSATAQKLQALIARAVRPQGEASSGGSLILPDRQGVPAIVIHAMPASPSSTSLLLDKERAAACLFIVSRGHRTTQRIHSFGVLFKLTQGEMRVLAELITGESPTTAAQRLKVTEPTVRTHLQHILAKTDTHRQAELIRLFFEATFA